MSKLCSLSCSQTIHVIASECFKVSPFNIYLTATSIAHIKTHNKTPKSTALGFLKKPGTNCR